jgi:hypothetical protein
MTLRPQPSSCLSIAREEAAKLIRSTAIRLFRRFSMSVRGKPPIEWPRIFPQASRSSSSGRGISTTGSMSS